jgi:hypothetical protein
MLKRGAIVIARDQFSMIKELSQCAVRKGPLKRIY